MSEHANVPYVVRLDRRYELLGVYSAGVTTWTLPVEDPAVDTIVLGDQFEASGLWYPPDSNSGTSITLAGRFDYGLCVLGHAYDMNVELTRPFHRDQNGTPNLKAWLTLRAATFAHHNTGYYEVLSQMTSRADRSRVFSFAYQPGEEFGTLTANFNGRCDDNRLFVLNNTPRPSVISAIDYHCDFVLRV